MKLQNEVFKLNIKFLLILLLFISINTVKVDRITKSYRLARSLMRIYNLPEIIKPLVDHSDIKRIFVGKIKFYLVSEKKMSNKSVFLMKFPVGSAIDKEYDIPGVAHLLEHVIHLGSENYEKNYLGNYLSQNQGVRNAYTAWEETVYEFQVNSEKLEEALKIDFDMFTKPLLKESDIFDDISSVDSEFNGSNGLFGRYIELIKSISIKNNNWSINSCGNKSLIEPFGKAKVAKAIQSIHSEYYRPELATAVLKCKVLILII